MRPPVTMPLDETIMLGYLESLIFFESSCVTSKWKLGHSSGEPYFSISAFVSGVNSSVCFRKMSTALIAIGLSACTGTLGTCFVSISCFSRNRNFCDRSTAKDGTATLQRGANERRQLGAGIGVRMLPVAVGALHHQQIAVLALGWAGVHHFPRSNLVVTHSSDIAREEKLRGLAIGSQRDFR